jgi:hypothetical protein
VGLLPETLFLTVNLLDRYCSKRVLYKIHYQLLGCAALLIAAKYADKKDRVPEISQLYDFCNSLYDTGMFTQMEIHVLVTLDWIIAHPTVDFFCRLMVAEEGYDQEVAHMAAYLCEVALYHREFVSIKPSIMSRSSLELARALLGRTQVRDGDWQNTENETLKSLERHAGQPSPTVLRKYSTSQFPEVSRKLDELVGRQACIPYSPVDRSTLCGKPVNKKMTDVDSTTQNQQVVGQFHAFPTPPITPESGY